MAGHCIGIITGGAVGRGLSQQQRRESDTLTKGLSKEQVLGSVEYDAI